MLMRYSNPVLAADSSFFGGVEEVGHHCFVRERLLVICHRLDFNEADAAVQQRVIIIVAMRFLNDDFVLQAGHIRRHLVYR